jgi:glycosyltransferase involved in cell wall biosynthesis
MSLIWRRFRYVIVSKWSYPGGGGESFLKDTVTVMEQMGAEVYWIAREPHARNQRFTKFRVRRLGNKGCLIEIPFEFNSRHFGKLLEMLQPSVVHTQGDSVSMIVSACDRLHIPILVGFHFWNDLIHMGPKRNTRMLEYGQHRTHNNWPNIRAQASHVYVASSFMKQVVATTGVVGLPVFEPVPLTSRMCKYNSRTAPFVTLLNCHPAKGGTHALALMRALRDQVRFRLCVTEGQSPELANLVKGTKSVISGYVKNVANILLKTRILLIPSMVDETYCRVAVEAAKFGIPVITTGAGNIVNLIGDCDGTIILENADVNAWIPVVKELYGNHDRLAQMSIAMAALGPWRLDLVPHIYRAVTQSTRGRVMIFVPWVNQGLGIQARHYTNIMRAAGMFVAIFAFLPYWQEKPLPISGEWVIPNVPVFQSTHNRERVPATEIESFVHRHRIGTLIIPETCNDNVFKIARQCNDLGVQTIAIPNIEIVRASEVTKHRVFRKIICNNRMTMNIFGTLMVKSELRYLGFVPTPILHKEKEEKHDCGGKIRFICVGGRNAVSRKQFRLIMEAVRTISAPFELTLTSQKQLPFEVTHPNVTLIIGDLHSHQLCTLMQSSDVVIQVSKHEGLGLGFTEAIQLGKPVISLDVSPHNEIIHANINGWLLPVTYTTMTEHKECLIQAATFDPTNLATIMRRLIHHPEELERIRNTTREDYKKRFNFEHFSRLLVTHVIC